MALVRLFRESHKNNKNKKIMSNSKAIAKDVFARFPAENKVYVTSDGQAFLNESHARNHAVSNRKGQELKMEAFLRDGVEKEAEKEPEKTAAQLIEIITAATSVEDVQGILSAEKAGKSRKSVIEAAEKRITELTKVK
jgi:hypothetical protein